MFGFSKEVLLKKELLYYLDRQTDYVSSHDIAETMGNITSQTVLKYIKELEEDLAKVYEPSEISLQVNKRFGIKLFRHNANFGRVLEFLFMKSPVYEIFKELLLHRQVDTGEICEQMEISLSNLKRIITRINEAIATYGLRMTVGTNVKITGKESSIRFVFFLFFYHVHHTYSNIPWQNDPTYLERAHKISSALYADKKPIMVETIALWLFINQIAKENDSFLESLDLYVYFNENIIEKSHVSDLDLNEWYYFLLCLYALDILDLSLFLNLERIHNHHFSNLSSQWIELYEKHFERLTIEEKIWVRLTFQKSAIFERFQFISSDLSKIFSPINYQEIETHYPVFIKKFEIFCKEMALALECNDNLFFYAKSLELCLRFTSPDKMAMTVSVFLMTVLSNGASKRIKKQLQNNFLNRVNLIFTEEMEEADLIITTEELPTESIEKDKEVIVIRPVFSTQDLRHIEKRLYAWKKKH